MKIVYRTMADFIVLVHFGFVIFSVGGAVLVFRWKKIMWIHLPAAFWSILIEMTGWICPLTPLEIWCRQKSGAAGYKSGFIEHYVLSLLYPANLTKSLQIILAAAMLVINVSIYGWIFKMRMKIKH